MDILIKVFTFPRSKLFRNPLKRNSSSKGAKQTSPSASNAKIYLSVVSGRLALKKNQLALFDLSRMLLNSTNYESNSLKS